MKATPYLVQRGHSWFFERRVPRELVPVVGKSSVRETLGTRHKTVAARRARIRAVELDEEWDALRLQRKMAGLSAPQVLALHGDAIEAEVQSEPIDGWDTPLSAMLPHWERETKPRADTVADVRRALAEYGDRGVHDVTRRSLVQYRDGLLEQGLSPATVKKRLAGISTLMNQAMHRGEIENNPAAGLTPRGSAHTVEAREAAAPEAAYALSDATKGTDSPVRWIAMLARWCGLRLGEIAQLRQDDLREEAGQPFVFVNDRGTCHGKPRLLKSRAATRLVPVPAQAEEFWRWAKGRAGAAALGPAGELFSFKQDRNGRVSTAASRAFKAFTDAHSIECTPHQLRHAYEDTLRAVAVPFEVQEALLGHQRAGGAVTAMYGSQLYPVGPLVEAAARISAAAV